MEWQMADLAADLGAHVQVLAAEIGSRPCGSDAHHAAEAYIRAQFEQVSLQVSDLRSDCAAWHAVSARLTVVGGQDLPVRACTFAPTCDVTAATMAVCTLAELEAADVAGKVVLLYGDLAERTILPAQYAIYTLARDQQLNRLLAGNEPAAVIGIRAKQPPTEPLFQDWDLTIPTAEVGIDAGLALLARVGEPVRLQLATEREPSHTSTLVGMLPGSKLGRIVICAHYDTKFDTPGASDNGGGTAVLLALAKRFGQRQPAVTLEFVAFGDEEHYGLGDLAYVAAQRAGFDDILACINVDGAGHALGTNTITAMGQSDGMQAALEAIVTAYPAVNWVEPWPQSNHSTFAWRGVPCVALTSTATIHSAHLALDRVEMVSAAKLAEAARIAGEAIILLQGKTADWTRP